MVDTFNLKSDRSDNDRAVVGCLANTNIMPKKTWLANSN